MMNNSIKTFKEWYNELDPVKKSVFRDAFLEGTGLKYPSFYSKLSRGKFSKLEKEFIFKYAGCELIFLSKK